MRSTIQRAAFLFLTTMMAIAFICPVAFASTTDVGMEPAYPDPNNERSQSIFIMKLGPTEQGKNGVRLINSSKETRTVEIYPTDSVSSVSGSFSCRQRAEKAKDVGAWISLDQTKVTLGPGEQKIIDFTVSVPKNTGPGEHDGCIAVQDSANLPATSGSGVLLGVRSAIRIAITVPGKIVKKLTIIRVDIKHLEGRGISVAPVAKNSGNVSLDVTARAQLVSIFGQESKVKSNAKYPIMQGATMGWAYAFEGFYWGGIYKARTSLSYNADPNAGIGQGTSDLQRVRGDSGWFIAYPHPLAAVAELAVVGAFAWLIVTPLRRRMQRRHISRNWQKYTVMDGDTLAKIAKNHSIKWKKLARHNHVKAPYLIEKGQVLLVPVRRQTKKGFKKTKTTSPELDWLSDSASGQPSVEPVEEPSAVNQPKQDVPTVSPAANDWQAPQYEPKPLPPEPVENRTPAKSYAAPAHSTTPNPMFPEPDDVAVPDWRDGASEEELRQFGVITDSSSVSHIQNSWSIDDENPEKPAEKTPKKRSSSTIATKPRKKTTKKTSSRTSGKKK